MSEVQSKFRLTSVPETGIIHEYRAIQYVKCLRRCGANMTFERKPRSRGFRPWAAMRAPGALTGVPHIGKTESEQNKTNAAHADKPHR